MSEISYESKFKSNLLDFVDLVHELVADSYDRGFREITPCTIDLCKCAIQGFREISIIEAFIKRSNKNWDHIHDKEEKFFIDHCHNIFGELPITNVNSFRALIEAKDNDGNFIISAEDREAVWGYMHSFVKLCIKFIHMKKGPTIRNESPDYKYNFFDGIDVFHHAKKWGIDLIFDEDEDEDDD
jgi:hypothetical protein